MKALHTLANAAETNTQTSGFRADTFALSADEIGALKAAIEHSVNPAIEARIGDIFRIHQILLARGIEHNGRRPGFVQTHRQRRESVAQWAYLVCLTNSLFKYSRGQAEQPDQSIEVQDMWGQMYIALDCTSETYPIELIESSLHEIRSFQHPLG